jgi:hypothetical protein
MPVEVTRRKLGTNTTDWRYDNDTFIICLAENGSGDYTSEAGGMVSSGSITPTSILDPDSVYNFRISPGSQCTEMAQAHSGLIR